MNILEMLDRIPDFRVVGRCKYRLGLVLGLALIAMMGGATSYRQMARFANAHLDWLRRAFFPDLRKVPSHDVFRNVFVGVAPGYFCTLFSFWAASLRTGGGRERTCVDGKALRGAARPDGTIPYVVSLWSETGGFVLGQTLVPEKTNEIAAMPPLLGKLLREGDILSADAAGCQRKNAKLAVERKADYLFALKGNQGSTLEEVRLLLESLLREHPEELETAVSLDKGHGRIERRTCHLSRNVAYWREGKNAWPGIRSVFRMVNERTEKGKGTTAETLFYITSLDVGAREMLALTRAHWGIENRLHYVKDVDFGEDACRARTGHSAMNLSTMRHILLNLINRRRPKDVGVKEFHRSLAWDQTLLVQLLGA